MVSEIHLIRAEASDEVYELRGVPVFEHAEGSVPEGSLLAAAADEDPTNPFPTLGGGFGSSIVRLGQGVIERELDRAGKARVRQVAVDVEIGKGKSALVETAKALADRDDADYIVFIRERATDD